MPRTDEQPVASAWPHRLAIALLCATVMLLVAGGLVTTTGAGMAFRDWPTSDGENMLTYPFWKAAGDKFVEHGHRLMGALVGLITIAMAVAVWLGDRRRWVHWLAVIAVALVIAQGVLGGLRVRADAVQLARLHGCVAPLFFALVAAIAVVTSKSWRLPQRLDDSRPARRLQRLAVFTVLLAYVQLVLGANLRHVVPNASPDSFRLALIFHLILAGALLVQAALLAVSVLRQSELRQWLKAPALSLLLLVTLQIALGAGTWVLKYSWPAGVLGQSQMAAEWTNTAGSFTQAATVTTHVVTGSLILATSLWLSLRLFRIAPRREPVEAARASMLEAVR